MKQKLFLSLIAIALSVLSASAQNEEKLVVNAGSVEHISIANEMNIVLMPGTYTDRSISLDPNASDKLNLKLSDNKLTIESVKHRSGKEKLIVYLYVNNLKTITVEGNSLVNTVGVLDTRKLDVFIDGDAKVHLKTNGTVNAHSLNNTTIKIKNQLENSVVKRGY